MCIKIVKCHQEDSYDLNKPLEDQISGCSQIIVNYEPFDKEVDKFLQEMERFAKTGISMNLNIKVVHNDNIIGIKTKKKLKKATNDIKVNEIVKLMVLSQIETDKKLEELANTFADMVK